MQTQANSDDYLTEVEGEGALLNLALCEHSTPAALFPEHYREQVSRPQYKDGIATGQ